jgi:DNA-binding beta-propeller fold protein YncE
LEVHLESRLGSLDAHLGYKQFDMGKSGLKLRRAFAILTLAWLSLPQGAWAKWYLLASVHPNNLIVIDTDTDKVVKNITLEGRGPAMNSASNPAQPQYAYVVNELAQSVAMVDLDEGKQGTSFPLSTPDELVRTMAIEVNPEGSRLFVHEVPVKKAPGHYEALPNRIRVIDLKTNTTVKTFPAPRQVMAMVFAKDGKRLYVFSVGQDITGFRRKVYRETSKIITICYLRSQGIELLYRRW